MHSEALIDLVVIKPIANSRVLTEILLVTSGVLLLVGLTQVEIPLKPVPITGQSLAVLFIGATFGSKRGLATTTAYIAIGLAGLPVFAAGASGLATLSGVTGGYIVGFLVAAFLMGKMSEMGLTRTLKNALIQCTVGHAVIFTAGVLWLSYFTGMKQAITSGLIPFIPGAVVKTILAAAIISFLWKIFKKDLMN
jgi:biotin transport system substrate-specific component